MRIILDLPDQYASELKDKFPELKKFTDSQLMRKLVEDYLDFDVFLAKYYTQNDINELMS